MSAGCSLAQCHSFTSIKGGEEKNGLYLFRTNCFTNQLLAVAELCVPDGEFPRAAVRLESNYPFSDPLERLRSALEARRFRIFATIDHRAAAQSVGLEMPPATVRIYGDPGRGTSMMIAAPDFALERPLRLLAREGENTTVHVTFNLASCLEGKGLPRAMEERLAGAERRIAETLGVGQ